MKIAMIGQKGIPCTGGGIERNVEDLSVHIAALGHEVIAYTRPHYTDSTLRMYCGVTLVSLPSLHTKHLDAIVHTFLSTLHAIIIKKVDIIHYHGIGPGLCTFLPRILAPRVRVIGTFHSEDWKHQKWNLIARSALQLGAYMMGKTAHVTIAISRAIQERVKSTTGKNAVYIPYGVHIQSRKPSFQTLAQFGLTRATPYILAASRFVRHKGIHEVINAFIRLKKNRTPQIKKLKLVLAGGGAFTDAYVRELRRLAKGNADIVFTGFQQGETLNALYAHARLFISPSITEGRSISLLEALAWGTPVAVADITETREFMHAEHHRSSIGILFPPHDIRAMSEAMRMTVFRPRMLQNMAKRGKHLVSAQYEWKKVAKMVDDLYIRLSIKSPTFADLTIAAEDVR